MGALADDVMLGKDVLLVGGPLGVGRVSSFPCSLWEIFRVASLKVLVDSIVLIFPTRLGVCLARMKHWQMQKLSLPLMSKAADSSTSTTLLRASLRRGLRKPTCRASGGLWVGPAGTAGQAAERSLMAKGVGEQALHAHSSIGGVHRHAQAFGLLCSGMQHKK